MIDDLYEEERLTEQLDLIHQLPLFRELFESDIRRVHDIAEPQTHPRGFVLYRQGETTKKMYVVLSGQIALHRIDADGIEQFGGHIIPGQSVGESSLLLGESHDVNAEVAADVELLAIERDKLYELFDEVEGLRGRLTPNPENALKMKLSELKFDWLGDEEVIQRFIRKHRWALYRSLALPIALAIAIVTAVVVLGSTIALLGILLLVVGIPIVSLFCVYVYLDWRDDVYVITDRRLVHIENVPLIRHNRVEAPISKVENVEYERSGTLAHILDFGNLNVETLSGSVAMKDIPQPEEIKDVIFREAKRQTSQGRAVTRQSIRDELESRIVQEKEGYEAPTEQEYADQLVREAQQEQLTTRSLLQGILRYLFPKVREEIGETVTYRKHWVALLRKGRYPFIGLFATFLGLTIWYNRGFLIGQYLPDSAWWVWPLLFVIFSAWTAWIFEDWRNDLYILTRGRIIDIERTPFLLSERRREAELHHIQSTEIDIASPWARLLRYGDVIIRLASDEYIFRDMKNPRDVQEEVTQRIAEHEAHQAAVEARQRKDELSDWFSAYDHIRTTYKPKESGLEE